MFLTASPAFDLSISKYSKLTFAVQTQSANDDSGKRIMQQLLN